MAARPKSSSTERWRERGNKQYEMAQQSQSAAEQLGNYKKSTHFFKKAFDEADTDEEEASAAKNLAMTHWQLAQTLDNNDDEDDDEGDDEIVYERETAITHYNQALEQFSIACVSGQNSKPVSWSTKLAIQMNSCLQGAFKHVEELDSGQETIAAINDIVDVLQDGKYKTECYTKLARVMYDQGLRALAKNDFQEALDLFKECNMPIEQAKQNGHSLEVTELQRNIKRKTRIGEARQILQTAIHLKDNASGMQETDQDLKMETIYGAIDACREAISITKESELEIEAMSLSYLGQVYDILLQQKDKAKEYFMRCVQLTEAMSNQSFVLQDWYSTCTQKLESYQESTVQSEEKSKREIIKNELQKEMKILDEGRTKYRTDIPGRLLYISEKFPPTKRTFVLPKKDDLRAKEPKELKSIIRKLVMDYHGDKQRIKEKKLKILNEEITKYLNDCLEYLKCD